MASSKSGLGLNILISWHDLVFRHKRLRMAGIEVVFVTLSGSATPATVT